MKQKILITTVLSFALMLGSGPAVLLAHDGHTHTEDRGGYRGEREDADRYDPRYDEDRWEDEEDEADYDDDRSSTRPYPPPDWERRTPRERKNFL